ncbi:uncharacterized protein PV07_10534 [Cladophialophora immunda]|uniref:non-specific serine/threonine protein kinase n=1 Tax=Cladophialophora immunda TaxID=569365 RepID=A0A0D1ZAW0_9EURO|nr:uncharacterized protein PV07_10534 [Cladophialophora immunda]KIW24846.1 hypothetical protein PV07_10534 [Cladophialophora immunda]
MDSFVQRVQNMAIGGRYHLVRKLGSGSFGNVYLGRDAETGNEVAMKLEHHSIAPSLLEEEVGIYQSLAGKAGFPQVYWHGHQDDFTILVFELLGPNLEDLFRYCGNQFSLKTTLMLADQLLRRFESLHSNNYLHRDVKPENFLLGMGERGNVVYMTDLGLAIYRRPDQWSSSTTPPRAVTARPPQLLGTCRYASINGHLGVAQSRRDDLEALGYMLVYFMRGRLPWQGLKAKRDAKYLLVLEKKQTISAHELCAGLPSEFEDYMNYVRNLRDEDQPDYQHLRKIFNKLFRRQGFEYDNAFDWTIREFLRLEPKAQESLASGGADERREEETPRPSGDAARNVTKAARRKR